MNCNATSAMLTAWKKSEALAFLSEVSSVPLQQALRHLQGAFGNFWQKRAKYPAFKSRKKSRKSAEYTTSGFRFRNGELTLAKMREPLGIVWSRPLPEGATPSTVTVSRDAAGRWFVSMLCDDIPAPMPGTTNAVAKGSRNRAKARLRVAKVHARIADRRRDHLHKLTTRLVRESQTIVIEDLTVRNMVKNHCLARAISEKNVLAEGLSVTVRGAGVRPERSSPGGQSATKQKTPRREP